MVARRIGELGSQLGGKLEGVANNFNNGTQRIMSELTKTQERNLEIYSKNEQKLADKFDDLIRILDGELRLITPTHPEGKQESGKYYQLTHRSISRRPAPPLLKRPRSCRGP